MKKLLTIALFLVTVITVSLNADKEPQTVAICKDGTMEKLPLGGDPWLACRVHRGLRMLKD